MQVTARQQFLLRKVVKGCADLNSPVGSKWLADQPDVPWGPSTVRSELARLEEIGLLEHPHYTRPQEFEGRPIPEVLISGNHAKIAAWRREQAEQLTAKRRPDLLTTKEY